MKWTKVSKKMLPAYTEFTDIFLTDPYATFVLGEIHKSKHWHKLANSEHGRFLQAYFHFLEETMWASARYAIHLDDKPGKRYRWDSLWYVMNLPSIRSKTQKKVVLLEPTDSKKHDIVQLVDVVLGALTSKATAPHKVALSAYVKGCAYSVLTKSGRPKIRTIVWSAPESRSFSPKI